MDRANSYTENGREIQRGPEEECASYPGRSLALLIGVIDLETGRDGAREVSRGRSSRKAKDRII